jgi:hypothetical protein
MDEDSWSSTWGFLRPWCHDASGWLRYVKGPLEVAPGQSFRGVQVQLSDGDGEKAGRQALREALGLLAAVAHVDNAAWRKLLVQDAYLDVGRQEEAFEGELMPRFQLALVGDGPDDDGKLLTGVSEFCGTQQHTGRSAAYKEAMARIAALGGKSCTGSTEIEIPITLQLGPWLTSSSDGMLAYLRRVQEMVRTLRMQWQQFFDQEQAPFSVAFVLESITADLRDVSISADVAELVTSLARDGIRMSGLALRHELHRDLLSNGNKLEARKVVGQLLFGLFGGAKKTERPAGNEWEFEATSMTGSLASAYGHPDQLTLEAAHFDCDAMQSWVFERLCSAMSVNQTTTHLSLGLELEDGDDSDAVDWGLCRWRWQWIIFACFSEKARLHSRLKSLALHNAVITTRAVEAMAAVLAAEGPEETLLGYPTQPSDALIDICIKAHSRVKLLSMHLDEALDTTTSFTLEREIAGVYLVSKVDRRDWVEALVPGFGRCQVLRKNLIYRELTLPSDGLAGVTSLEIKFGEDPDPKDLQGLLLLIGASLTHVNLAFDDFNTGHLEGIVASCPKLVELAVCTHTIEVRFCLRDVKYRDLALYSASHVSFGHVQAIAEVLCDSENPFTKCARRLRVDQRGMYHLHGEQFVVLLRMLEMNRSLEYFDIIAHRADMNRYNDFKAHHLESLPVALSALSMECRVALLSVMAAGYGELVGKKRRKHLSPMPVLDQHVLASIFEYAAPHVRRRVYFRQFDFFETGRYSVPI